MLGAYTKDGRMIAQFCDLQEAREWAQDHYSYTGETVTIKDRLTGETL